MTKSANYRATFVKGSRDFSIKERLMYKDFTAAVQIEDVIKDNGTIKVVDWAIYDVLNEALDNPEYTKYVLIDDDGSSYVTGSPSFWKEFMMIWEELENAGELEGMEIKPYKAPSKNYNGEFITCRLV